MNALVLYILMNIAVYDYSVTRIHERWTVCVAIARGSDDGYENAKISIFGVVSSVVSMMTSSIILPSVVAIL